MMFEWKEFLSLSKTLTYKSLQVHCLNHRNITHVFKRNPPPDIIRVLTPSFLIILCSLNNFFRSCQSFTINFYILWYGSLILCLSVSYTFLHNSSSFLYWSYFAVSAILPRHKASINLSFKRYVPSTSTIYSILIA